MTRGRTVAVVALAVVTACAVLVAVGRWERNHRADVQNAGIRRVLGQVGRLDSPSLSAFRYLTSFQCLLYRRNGNRVALELCVDAKGRVVEAIDRTGSGDPRISSLRDDPTRATTIVNRDEVDRLLVKMGVPRRLVEIARAQGS